MAETSLVLAGLAAPFPSQPSPCKVSGLQPQGLEEEGDGSSPKPLSPASYLLLGLPRASL